MILLYFYAGWMDTEFTRKKSEPYLAAQHRKGYFYNHAIHSERLFLRKEESFLFNSIAHSK
jgi:hypothetical protein